MFFLSEKEFSFPLRGKVGMGVVSPVVILLGALSIVAG